MWADRGNRRMPGVYLTPTSKFPRRDQRPPTVPVAADAHPANRQPAGGGHRRPTAAARRTVGRVHSRPAPNQSLYMSDCVYRAGSTS